jgi:vacuolar-type H+-ATPase subunit H
LTQSRADALLEAAREEKERIIEAAQMDANEIIEKAKLGLSAEIHELIVKKERLTFETHTAQHKASVAEHEYKEYQAKLEHARHEDTMYVEMN